MKKIVPGFFLSLFIVCSMHSANAQTLIHYWHFNDTTNATNSSYVPNIPPVDADYSIIDTAKARIYYNLKAGTSSAYSTYRDFVTNADTTNARLGHGTDAVNYAIRFRNPCDSMDVLIYIPSKGYNNPALKFATESTTNGPKSQQYAYSTDSGTTWKTSGLSIDSFVIPDTSIWHLVTVTFDASANNNSGLIFKINFGFKDTGTAGNDRFDNFSLEGTPVPSSVPQITATAFPGTLYPNPANSNINIYIPVSGEKAITIYNATGQKILSFVSGNNEMPVNISQLSSGLYFVNVQMGQKHNLMQFIKN